MKPEEIELVRRDYAANGGWETFLAYEDPRQDILVGLLRLRKVSGAVKSRQAELQGRCSIVRELHVYGTAVAVSARDATKQQHQVRAPAVVTPHAVVTSSMPMISVMLNIPGALHNNTVDPCQAIVAGIPVASLLPHLCERQAQSDMMT